MRIGYVLGISLQTELLILSFFGILCTVFDASLLEFNTNINKIWDLKMDPSKFSERAELYMKYVMSGVLLVRTFSVHLYLGTYIIMLYPIIFDDRPRLIIPWMAINVLKCLITGVVSTMAGTYLCFVYKWMKPPCWEFVLSLFMDYTPSIYMFCLVLTFYKDLTKLMKINKYIDPVQLKARRRRARLLTDSQHMLEYSDDFTRSFDGFALNAKGAVEFPTTTMQNHVSISTIDKRAFNNIREGSSWQELSVNAYLMRDAAVSGRSYRVSGSVLEVLGKAHNSTPKAKILEPAGTDEMEQLQKVSDLDSHDTTFQVPKRTMLTVETQVEAISVDNLETSRKKNEYNTVSELLNDPDIALVLNMITGKDEPFETDLSKLDNYEISITDEDPLWAYVSYGSDNGTPYQESPKSKKRSPKEPKEPNHLRAETQEAANQVHSPKFETAMSEFTPIPSKHIIPRSNIYEAPHRDVSIQSTASFVHHHRSTILDSENFPVRLRARSQSPAVNQLFKNNAAYASSYKDDGYTQAFVENMLKRKEKQL